MLEYSLMVDRALSALSTIRKDKPIISGEKNILSSSLLIPFNFQGWDSCYAHRVVTYGFWSLTTLRTTHVQYT